MVPSGSTSTRPRLNSLTGLRAFAALAVFFDHTRNAPNGFFGYILYHLGLQGAVGVTFFFVLSGFVLTWSMRAGDEREKFWRRRFARIYPVYLVALALGVVVTALERGPIGAGPLIANAGLVQAWIPSADYYFAINGVSWSLSCEAFFYFAFPLIIPYISKLDVTRRRALQFGLLGTILVLSVLADLSHNLTICGYIDHCPLTRSIEFVLGCTAAIDVMEGRRLRVSSYAAMALALCTYVACGYLTGPLVTVALPVIPFLVLIVACAQDDADGKSTVVNRRYLVWLGDISYCFYLSHDLVIRALVHFSGSSSDLTHEAFNFVGSLLLAVLVAAALHRFVEKPMEKWLRGGSGKRSSQMTFRQPSQSLAAR